MNQEQWAIIQDKKLGRVIIRDDIGKATQKVLFVRQLKVQMLVWEDGAFLEVCTLSHSPQDTRAGAWWE